MRIVRRSELVTVGKTHCQDHQDPSKSVSIFDRETEANLKMVSINSVSIPRSRTVWQNDARSNVTIYRTCVEVNLDIATSGDPFHHYCNYCVILVPSNRNHCKI